MINLHKRRVGGTLRERYLYYPAALSQDAALNDFCGERRIRFVNETLLAAQSNGFAGIVWGTRRMGKTSIFNRLALLGEAQGLRVLRLSGHGIGDRTALVDRLLQVTGIQRTFEDDERCTNYIFDQLVRDERKTLFLFDEPSAWYEEDPFFFQRYRERLDSGAPFSIVFISFLEALQQRQVELEARRSLGKIKSTPSSSMNICQEFALDPFDKQDVRNCLMHRWFAPETGGSEPENALDRLMALVTLLSGGSPFIVQGLGQLLYNIVRKDEYYRRPEALAAIPDSWEGLENFNLAEMMGLVNKAIDLHSPIVESFQSTNVSGIECIAVVKHVIVAFYLANKMELSAPELFSQKDLKKLKVNKHNADDFDRFVGFLVNTQVLGLTIDASGERIYSLRNFPLTAKILRDMERIPFGKIVQYYFNEDHLVLPTE